MDDLAVQLGAPVRCADGEPMRLADVVVDPATRRLTHLVVDTGDGQARLVPAEAVAHDRTQRREVALTCTAEDVRSFDPVREVAYVGLDGYPELEGRTDVGVQDTFVLTSPGAVELGGYAGDADATVGVAYDVIPSGEAELRRESTVLSSDGEEVGHVDGFLLRDALERRSRQLVGGEDDDEAAGAAAGRGSPAPGG